VSAFALRRTGRLAVNGRTSAFAPGASRQREVPPFSVIVPVDDKARHVESAIRSVLEQTLPSFELIIVDDASTDGSREIVDAIDDSRIRRQYRDTPGPGGYAARNLGISVARGAWVTFLDADDTWASDRLERLSAMIRSFPDADLHACAWLVAAREGPSWPNRYARRHGARGAHAVALSDYLTSLRRNEPVIHTDTVAIRRAALPDADVFPAGQGVRRGGDVYAWLRLMCRVRWLVWSSHIGATYYTDSDNMVTRRVPSQGYVLSRERLEPLAAELTPPERRLLRSTANGMIWRSWLGNALRGSPGFALPGRLFWRGAFWQALLLSVGSSVPPAVIRLARRLAKLSCPRG